MRLQRKGPLILFVVLFTVGTIAVLNVVRSKMIAEQQVLKRAIVEYSALRRIYATPSSSHRDSQVLVTPATD